MRLICAPFVCLLMLQAIQGPAGANEQARKSCSKIRVEALSNRIELLVREMKDDQLTRCKSHEQLCAENNQLLRNHFELLNNSLDRIATELSENHEKVIELQKEIEKKNDQIKKLQTEITDYKIKQNVRNDQSKISQPMEKRKYESCTAKDTGIKSVTLSKGYNFEVLCNSDIAGPGWTVIQQRIRGGVDFYRDWNTYRNGFGDFWDGDFFLGLQKIHRLTTEQPHELYIHMTRFNGSTYYARYDEFAISGEEDQYRLSTLGTFTGTTVNEFQNNKYNGFTTFDRDNDLNTKYNNADFYHSGWWYSRVAHCNLNGKYYETETSGFHAIFWEDRTALKQVKMMIRPKQA